MHGIGYKARAPKKMAKKSEWKQFIDYFIHSSDNRGAMKRIIALRKEYGLSTLKQEQKLTKMLEVHEEKFGCLDIKHHEKLLEVENYTWSNNPDKNFVESVDKVVDYHKTKTVKNKDVTNNKEYFIVPIHATVYGMNVFPADIAQYDIYKVRSVANRSTHSSNKYNFRIKTNNLNEIISEDDADSKKRYSSRQGFLVFDSREKAMTFRQAYLSVVVPYFKEKDVPFVGDLVKKANVDFDRVLKKAPELLV